MSRFMKAVGIAMQVLSAIESVRAKTPATLEIEYKGQFYTLVLSQSKVSF